MSRSGNRQNKEYEIIESTKRLLSHVGYGSLSVDTIAREAGVSKATFYAYFKSKEGLRQKLLTEGIDEAALLTKDNRSAILEAALKTFAERGFHATTLEAIAEAAGVTKGTIYWYFKTKDSLASALAEHYSIYQDITSLALSEIKDNDDGHLVATATRLLAIVEKNVSMVRMVILEAPHFPEVRDLVAREILVRNYSQFAEYLKRRIEAGIFRDVNPMVVAQIFFSSLVMFALVKHLFGGQFLCSKEEMVREFIRLFLNGIKKRQKGDVDEEEI